MKLMCSSSDLKSRRQNEIENGKRVLAQLIQQTTMCFYTTTLRRLSRFHEYVYRALVDQFKVVI